MPYVGRYWSMKFSAVETISAPPAISSPPQWSRKTDTIGEGFGAADSDSVPVRGFVHVPAYEVAHGADQQAEANGTRQPQSIMLASDNTAVRAAANHAATRVDSP